MREKNKRYENITETSGQRFQSASDAEKAQMNREENRIRKKHRFTRCAILLIILLAFGTVLVMNTSLFRLQFDVPTASGNDRFPQNGIASNSLVL